MRAIWVSSSVLLFAILAAAWPGAGQQPTDTRQQEEAVKSLAALTGNCVACHATYRLDHAR